MGAAVTDLASSLSGRAADGLHSLLRRGILAASGNRGIARGVRRYGMQLGAARFVAGERFDDAIPVLRSLNEAGFRTNTTLLGEHVETADMAREVANAYKGILDRIAAESLTTNVALKLTHLGLDLGDDVACENLHGIVAHAANTNAFIRIDMEESSRVDATLAIYRRLREAGFDNVGTVLQSYLYRTGQDLDALLPLLPNLRLVKGAYLEPADIAYPNKADVDAALRDPGGAHAPRRRLHRHCHPRRAHHRASDRVHQPAWHRPRSIRVPDAVWDSPAAATRPCLPRISSPGRYTVWSRLVPVPDAPARRATSQRDVLRAQRDPPLGSVRPGWDSLFSDYPLPAVVWSGS